MKRFFTNLFATGSKATKSASRANHNAFRPSFDELETRDCMSTTAVLNSLGILNIIGDAKVNKVAVTMNETKGLVDVAIGKKHKMFKTDLVKEINIDLKGGNDFLNVDATSPLWHGKNMNIAMSNGNDTVDLLLGADANTTLDNAFAVRMAGGTGVVNPKVADGAIMAMKAGHVLDPSKDAYCQEQGDLAQSMMDRAEELLATGKPEDFDLAMEYLKIKDNILDGMENAGCWYSFAALMPDTRLQVTLAGEVAPTVDPTVASTLVYVESTQPSR